MSSKHALIEKLEKNQKVAERPKFRVGDTLKISLKIVEGEKVRTQVVTGTVISKKGRGLSETFSLHRVAYGEGMERVFLLNSPRIEKIEIVKSGKVRRSKLYFLRGTSGKASKLRAIHTKSENKEEKKEIREEVSEKIG